jgi:hypothetical protein
VFLVEVDERACSWCSLGGHVLVVERMALKVN